MSEAADLEREAEAARARLSDTAEELRSRMSPGQMMDEVLNQFRGGDGNQMLANLRNQARDNPMALALVGSGLAWLMMGSGPDASRSHAPAPAPMPRRPLSSAYPSSGSSQPVGSGAYGAGTAGTGSYAAGTSGAGASEDVWGDSSGSSSEDDSSGGGMIHGASEAISSAGQAVGDRLHKVGDMAGEWARGVQSAGSDAMSGAAHGVSGAAHGVRHSAADFGQQARNGFLDMLEREPLVIGALGVAVGAAIGALLPATEIERQHLAPAGEALKDKATTLVDQGMAEAKEMASEVYETARDEADRQGLLPGDRPIAEKIDAVVRATGEKIGSSVEEKASAATSDTDTGTSPATGSGTSPATGSGTRTGSGSTGSGSGTGSGIGSASTGSGTGIGSASTGSSTGTGTGSSTNVGTGTGSGKPDRT
jgi:hypothetical protein